jgi:glycosyltransferase involved in cell wall biosynthesis
MGSNIRVSIVIPAFNESEYLYECLKAIAKQTIRPFEVIVVDNNSTDDTVAVAKRFHFVRVITERRQGVLYARTAGFHAVRGDIIGRIDCDTTITPNWVETVIEIFSNEKIAAVSGVMEYDDMALRHLINRADLFFRRWLAASLVCTNTQFLQGASMAIRRDAWNTVSSSLCKRSDIHEDYDLALHLQQRGFFVVFDERLRARLSMRRIDASLLNIIRYSNVSPYSYRVHKAAGWMRMYIIIAVVIVAYAPARVLYRGYDSGTGKFRLSKVFSTTIARISPVTYSE